MLNNYEVSHYIIAVGNGLLSVFMKTVRFSYNTLWLLIEHMLYYSCITVAMEIHIDGICRVINTTSLNIVDEINHLVNCS